MSWGVGRRTLPQSREVLKARRGSSLLVSEDLGIAGVPHVLLLPTVVGTDRRGCPRASEGTSAAVRTSALGTS